MLGDLLQGARRGQRSGFQSADHLVYLGETRLDRHNPVADGAELLRDDLGLRTDSHNLGGESIAAIERHSSASSSGRLQPRGRLANVTACKGVRAAEWLKNDRYPLRVRRLPPRYRGAGAARARVRPSGPPSRAVAPVRGAAARPRPRRAPAA